MKAYNPSFSVMTKLPFMCSIQGYCMAMAKLFNIIVARSELRPLEEIFFLHMEWVKEEKKRQF